MIISRIDSIGTIVFDGPAPERLRRALIDLYAAHGFILIEEDERAPHCLHWFWNGRSEEWKLVTTQLFAALVEAGHVLIDDPKWSYWVKEARARGIPTARGW